MSCRSCAAFFRRCIRKRSNLFCRKDPILCEESVSGEHMCKKCRMRRCYRVGMLAKYVRNIKAVDYHLNAKTNLLSESKVFSMTGLPLLTCMTEVVKNAFRQRCAITDDVSQHYGTSEQGHHLIHYGQHRMNTYGELRIFYEMLKSTPIICDLQPGVREQIFKKSLLLYISFIQISRTLAKAIQTRPGFTSTPTCTLTPTGKK
ncbi:hypothetical protein L596_022822 [Steinernema carpocapsae]|uniref:Nuclear receptor domain-containing protein n=1 Tax=Steinernema carpocapsae TaxID=34508 RepID=A0A4U5MMY3_STECR|nr:hypothetical protein L596_022822 [Steinernema carpocapsae]